MQHESVEFHGVGELASVDGGVRPQRVPESVRDHLNEGARGEMLRPGGIELRFVPEGAVEVILSCPSGTAEVVPFWGPFQAHDPVIADAEPTTHTFAIPEFLDELAPEAVEEFAFDPTVCRLRFHPDSDPVVVHGVDGEARPPVSDERPEATYLAYGTSITYGIAATGPHLTYPAQVARRLGVDAVNLGSSGSAFCEPEIADHIAGLEWDVASLALSVNMFGEFDVDTFRERAEYVIETVGATGRPVVAVTIYPFHPDLLAEPDPSDPPELAEFRGAVRDAAESAPDNVRVLDGPEVLDPAGLSTDIIHPGDNGMIRIGERLAPALAEYL